MLNWKAFVLLVLLVGSVSKTNAQSAPPKEKDDNSESAFPIFKDGNSGLMKYLNRLIPVIYENTNDKDNLPFGFKMILTIDTTSKVIDVDFLSTRMEDQCKSKVREVLLKMEGWKAAESNGKPIVGKYPFMVSCILWNR